jgi:hypothetical protein
MPIPVVTESIVVQDSVENAELGEQGGAAEPEQIDVGYLGALFLSSLMTSMVMVFVVLPGAKGGVPVLHDVALAGFGGASPALSKLLNTGRTIELSVSCNSADRRAGRSGPIAEWHLDFGKAFRRFAFEFLAWFRQPREMIATAFFRSWFKAIGTIGHLVGGYGL